jgi:hypothetical protein
MRLAWYFLVITALALSTSEDTRGQTAFLRLAGTSGTVIIDADTISADSDLLALDPGRHLLTYLPFQDSAKWEPPLADLPFHLSEGETLAVDLGNILTIRIETSPQGCEVRRAGTSLGATPLVLSTLAEFPDTLTISREGYLTAVISPTGLSHGSTFYTMLVPENGPTVQRSAGGTGSSNGSGGAVLKYSSLAASVAAISIGFWYKEKADSYYEDYLSHGNPETIDRLYRKSVEADDRARIFWIAGEAGAIVTSYFFLRDFFRSGRREERSHESP